MPRGSASFARFCGYPDVAAFSEALVARLETVQRHYAALFEDSPELTPAGVNMVFAGEQDDPGTVAALKEMGFSQPGRRAGDRARLAPRALRGGAHRAGARAADGGAAAADCRARRDRRSGPARSTSFDRFLSELPAGVQLFSLLRANPGLLRLLADIMGTAPRLARILSRRRRLLDAVLDPRTLGMLPTAEELDRLIAAEIGSGEHDMQYVLDRARVVGSEQQFLIGIRVLSGAIKANQAGGAYALLAERLIDAPQGGDRARAGALARARSGRRRGHHRHGQARRARDDGGLRPRPHPRLRLRCARRRSRTARARWRRRNTTRA